MAFRYMTDLRNHVTQVHTFSGHMPVSLKQAVLTSSLVKENPSYRKERMKWKQQQQPSPGIAVGDVAGGGGAAAASYQFQFQQSQSTASTDHSSPPQPLSRRDSRESLDQRTTAAASVAEADVQIDGPDSPPQRQLSAQHIQSQLTHLQSSSSGPAFHSHPPLSSRSPVSSPPPSRPPPPPPPPPLPHSASSPVFVVVPRQGESGLDSTACKSTNPAHSIDTAHPVSSSSSPAIADRASSNARPPLIIATGSPTAGPSQSSTSSNTCASKPGNESARHKMEEEKMEEGN